ncbi:hypothetical protein B0H11DRAFT_1898430 [Mycena galericulata]|nr:hypothetical protein B0H11DRAFT_1898430 [Mycena galericulata]
MTADSRSGTRDSAYRIGDACSFSVGWRLWGGRALRTTVAVKNGAGKSLHNQDKQLRAGDPPSLPFLHHHLTNARTAPDIWKIIVNLKASDRRWLHVATVVASLEGGPGSCNPDADDRHRWDREFERKESPTTSKRLYRPAPPPFTLSNLRPESELFQLRFHPPVIRSITHFQVQVCGARFRAPSSLFSFVIATTKAARDRYEATTEDVEGEDESESDDESELSSDSGVKTYFIAGKVATFYIRQENRRARG